MSQTESQVRAAIEHAERLRLEPPDGPDIDGACPTCGGRPNWEPAECDNAEDCAESGRRSCRGCPGQYQMQAVECDACKKS